MWEGVGQWDRDRFTNAKWRMQNAKFRRNPVFSWYFSHGITLVGACEKTLGQLGQWDS